MAPKRRGRGRPAGGSTVLVRTILSVTLAQLVKGGYSELSVDEIAHEAGVNKTTIYRRWPTKASLVVAAIVATRDRGKPFRRTGNFRRDLVRLLREKARLVSTPRQRAIACAINNLSPAVSEALVAELRRHRYTLPHDFIEQGIAEGELPKHANAGVIAELLLAPIFYRALVIQEAVPDSLIERTVAIVLAGTRSL